MDIATEFWIMIFIYVSGLSIDFLPSVKITRYDLCVMNLLGVMGMCES
jgi:hypothetical protein